MRRASKWLVSLVCSSCAFVAVLASAQVSPATPTPVPATTAPPTRSGPPYLVPIRMKGLHIGGRVMGGIYRDPELWTEDAGIVSLCSVRVRAREAICTFSVARAGSYAAAFFHDEDGDRELDKNFLGIPTEGYAFSRDARASLSAPAFERAAFTVPLTTAVIATMRY